jgi:hypothetical protein
VFSARPLSKGAVDGGARSGPTITIESFLPRNTADNTLRLSSCRFHERNFTAKSRQQKALENDLFSMGFERPDT